MNDFLSLAQKRYAVRSYLPKPVEAEKLERILEAGRVAPTAKNTQPFRFLVVQHPERLKKLSACTNVKGYPLARMYSGSVPSGMRNCSRMGAGSKCMSQQLPKPRSVASKSMCVAAIAASVSGLLLPSKGRTQTSEATLQTMIASG